jgi:hypothetical protein
MNCPDVRANLALLVYDDLAAADKHSIEQHVAQCPDCRKEYQALQRVRRTLGMVAVPEVNIDLPQLYRQAAERQERRLRRWRRLAIVAASAAAVLGLLMLGHRLEARIEAHQLVLRWGAPPVVPETFAPAETATNTPAQSSSEQQLLLSELIHALADSLQSVEHREQQDTAQLQARLLAIQQQNAQRWAELERTIDSLYQSLQKGE